jgi:phage terminase large subunit-like protein
MLGVDLMGWQRLAADRGLELDGGGLPVYREVDVSTDRQAGKSTLILSVAVRKMLSSPGSWVTYTSASRLAARRKLLRKWWPLIRRSPLADRFRVTKGTGSESLECSNGSVLLLLSVAEESGHGEEGIDLAILDECWSLDDAAEAAVRPSMATKPGAQLWCVSTAGTPRSGFWRSKVDAGRAAAGLGVTDSGLCFVEWAAGRDVDVTDEGTWPSFMPALNRTIPIETVRADLTAMKPGTWRRCYANQWPDEADEGWSVISRDAWMAARL